MKNCFKCKVSKKVNFFWKTKKTKDGLQETCIDCCRKYYFENKVSIKNRKLRYNKNKDKGLYVIYCGIRQRCLNANSKKYHYYGGRGIKCLWNIYREFKRDMYESYIIHMSFFGKKNTTIERVNNNGNYCKDNCKWATMKEQNNNHMKHNQYTKNKLSVCLSD